MSVHFWELLCHRFTSFTYINSNCLGTQTLQWRHNERDGVSNHQPRHCLLNRLFRHRSKQTSKLHVTGVWEGWPVNSPHKGPVTRKMFPFDDVIMCGKLKWTWTWTSPSKCHISVRQCSGLYYFWGASLHFTCSSNEFLWYFIFMKTNSMTYIQFGRNNIVCARSHQRKHYFNVFINTVTLYIHM